MQNQRTTNSDLKFLTQQEKEELFLVISKDHSRFSTRNKAIFYISEYCALRASEIGLITLNDIDLDKNTVFCRRLKGSKNNTLRIVNPVVLNSLKSYYWERVQQTHNSNCLFLSQLEKPISRKTLDYLMKQYCSQTKIPPQKHHFHALKHTRAIEMIDYPDIKLTDVQWWLGHRNIQNTMIYLDYTSNAMNSLFNKLKSLEGGEICDNRT